MRLEKNRVICTFITILIFSLPCLSQGATMAAPPATPTLPSIPNPSAPPQGTIAIPPSANPVVNASSWATGSYQQIQWICSGMKSNEVNVTLWLMGNKAFTLGTGIYTGKTAWTVPITMTTGNYELRVTSAIDPRIEARKTIAIRLAKITITAPKAGETVYLGRQRNITWTYDGNPGAVDFKLIGKESGRDVMKWPDPPVTGTFGIHGGATMANGYGIVGWTPPSYPFWPAYPYKGPFSFRLVIQSTDNNKIIAESPEFKFSCPNTYCTSPERGAHWCADLKSIIDCGSCGNDCREKLKPPREFSEMAVRYNLPVLIPPTVCDNGQCRCAPGWHLCPAGTNTSLSMGKWYCANLKNDNYNCAVCKNKCPAGTMCSNGTCVKDTHAPTHKDMQVQPGPDRG